MRRPGDPANRCSNASHVGPAPESHPLAKTLATASSSASPTVGCPRATGSDIVVLLHGSS